MPELLDIYDDNLTHLGTKPRPQVHQDGDWHRVFHCWVIYRDDSGNDWVIFQKRGEDKEIFPGRFDVSAAGHYQAGEGIEDGMRELEEELGLSPSFTDLIAAGIRVSMKKYEGTTDREVADVFFYECTQPLEDYAYARDEVAGLTALQVTDGLRLFSGAVEKIMIPAVGLSDDTITVTTDDFVPTIDHYWKKVCLLTSQCLDGDDYLYI